MARAARLIAPRTRDEYMALRRRFEPESPKLIIIAESPPASGRYFYDPAGSVTEPLFAALMRQLGFSARTKESGLLKFQRQGWVLVDATYEPVNTLSATERDRVIRRDYPSLRKDLKMLIGKGTPPMILLKSNVCRLLESNLLRSGFNVINGGKRVYFPSTGRQTEFHRQFEAILRAAGIR